jgi:hypothetical protein
MMEDLPKYKGWENTAYDFQMSMTNAFNQYKAVLTTAKDISDENEKLRAELNSLRYHTVASCMHYFEKWSGEKREDIKEVWFDGGHGYTMCTVRTDFADTYIADEMEAAFMLDWAKAHGKLVDWKERRKCAGKRKVKKDAKKEKTQILHSELSPERRRSADGLP